MNFVLAIMLAILLAGAASARQQGAASPAEAEAARLNSEVVKLHRERKFDEALPLARRVVEMREKLHGPDHASVAVALFNFAAVLIEKREFGEAEKAYLRALAVAEKNGPAQATLAAEANTQLGQLRLRAGDYGKAASYSLRGLELKEQARDADLVPNLLTLIEIQLNRRDVPQADAYLDRLTAYLRARPPKPDPASAERMKSYLCALYGPDRALTFGKVWNAREWLRDPERTAERERELKARESDPMKAVVEGGVLTGRAVRKAQPSYPVSAKAHRVSGTVIVGITVNEEGKVVEAEALCGHPTLASAAVEAARDWLFTPTLLDGRPVKVTGTISINFVLR